MTPIDVPRHAVALLEADPDLAAGLDDGAREEALRRSVARVVRIESSRWDPREVAETAGPGWLGLFVVEGLLVRRVTVAGRTACELFGAGDVFRPWDEDGDYEPLAITVDWLALEPARIAVLDHQFALRVAPWPSIAAKLLQRMASRARHLALTQAVTHLPRTHARLLLLFWLLAERWGRVTRHGVVVTLPLTHQVLAMLVGSHRPTVTIALQKLARRDLLVRESSDRWLLTSAAIEQLHDPGALTGSGEDDLEMVVEAVGR